jgi:hypothetical protein
MIFIVIVVTFCYFPETSPQSQPKVVGRNESLKDGMKHILADKLLRKLFLVNCLHSFCNGSMLVGMVMFFSASVRFVHTAHVRLTTIAH